MKGMGTYTSFDQLLIAVVIVVSSEQAKVDLRRRGRLVHAVANQSMSSFTAGNMTHATVIISKIGRCVLVL